MGVKKVDKKILRKVYKRRKAWSRKHDFGYLLIIGGSKEYSGSPAFNALAALRAGVDLVTIVSPRRAADIIASFKPDLIVHPINADYLTIENLDEVLGLLHKKDAVVIGGGMCRYPEVLEFISEFLKRVKIPTVIDADAIYAASKILEEIEGKNFVLTPHTHEFYVLSGKRIGFSVRERVKEVYEFSKRWKLTVLLKGHVDVISDGKKVAINNTGTPFMTKGGMGDTLTGVLGAILARNVDPFTATCAAAWINGKAGELASKKFGEGTMASDLIEEIPKVIKL
ncbi:MAG: NAD(P)H-hydrate dehydratase [Candidatus Aenigmarchaeota archaeon]|nr:NAD(P)H-hydrate dehydratase [Candidatus Aenigmarchaeota archaeon]